MNVPSRSNDRQLDGSDNDGGRPTARVDIVPVIRTSHSFGRGHSFSVGEVTKDSCRRDTRV